MSPYKPRRPGSFKEALAQLVTACGGNEAAGAVLGFKKQHMRRLSDDGSEDVRHRIHYADVVKLEQAAGQPVVTRWAAERQGCIVEKVDSDAIRDPVGIVLGRITSETGDVLSAAATDMAKGVMTPAVARRVMKETGELLPAILDLREHAIAVLGGSDA